jgi:hypothetical protein
MAERSEDRCWADEAIGKQHTLTCSLLCMDVDGLMVYDWDLRRRP